MGVQRETDALLLKSPRLAFWCLEISWHWQLTFREASSSIYPPKREHAGRMRSILQTSRAKDDFEVFPRKERVTREQLIVVLDGARSHRGICRTYGAT